MKLKEAGKRIRMAREDGENGMEQKGEGCKRKGKRMRKKLEATGNLMERENAREGNE